MEEIEKSLKKMRKRITLGANVVQGKMGEATVETGLKLRGYKVKRIHKGGDYKVVKTKVRFKHSCTFSVR